MRWKIKTVVIPKNGEVRTRRVFAWKKTKVGQYMVWLEFYQVTEKFYQPVGGTPGWWSEIGRDTCDYYC
jgi:hypothetical protein